MSSLLLAARVFLPDSDLLLLGVLDRSREQNLIAVDGQLQWSWHAGHLSGLVNDCVLFAVSFGCTLVGYC